MKKKKKDGIGTKEHGALRGDKGETRKGSDEDPLKEIRIGGSSLASR